MTSPHIALTSHKQIPALLALAALFLFLLSACSVGDHFQSDLRPDNTYPIDQALKDFYNELDGKNFLGEALSPLMELNGMMCQYTSSALLCYDPQTTGIARYRVEPLGLALSLKAETPVELPIEEARIVDGYVLYPAFDHLYDHFYGSLYAGKPLTNAFYNHARNRIEQYFENLGFYINLDDAGQGPGLIEYGAWVCSDQCPADWESTVIQALPSRNDPRADFVVAVEFLGGSNLFGEPLTDLYLAADGSLEMVYEKAVFYAPVSQPSALRLRTLPAVLGMPAMSPGPRLYGVESQMDFYPVEGDLGYHIPLVFENFLQTNGGMSLSGDPIIDPYNPGSGIPRQCFAHFCLEYDKNAVDGEAVYLVDLGTQYLATQPEMTPLSVQGGVGQWFSEDSEDTVRDKRISFVVSEQSPQVRRGETQVIQIVVFDRETNQTVSGIQADLLVTMPDGTQVSYTFPPSDAGGKAYLQIEPVISAENGSLISYRVCLKDVQAPCKEDAYMIWGD